MTRRQAHTWSASIWLGSILAITPMRFALAEEPEILPAPQIEAPESLPYPQIEAPEILPAPWVVPEVLPAPRVEAPEALPYPWIEGPELLPPPMVEDRSPGPISGLPAPARDYSLPRESPSGGGGGLPFSQSPSPLGVQPFSCPDGNCSPLSGASPFSPLRTSPPSGQPFTCPNGNCGPLAGMPYQSPGASPSIGPSLGCPNGNCGPLAAMPNQNPGASPSIGPSLGCPNGNCGPLGSGQPQGPSPLAPNLSPQPGGSGSVAPQGQRPDDAPDAGPFRHFKPGENGNPAMSVRFSFPFADQNGRRGLIMGGCASQVVATKESTCYALTAAHCAYPRGDGSVKMEKDSRTGTNLVTGVKMDTYYEKEPIEAKVYMHPSYSRPSESSSPPSIAKGTPHSGPFTSFEVSDQPAPAIPRQYDVAIIEFACNPANYPVVPLCRDDEVQGRQLSVSGYRLRVRVTPAEVEGVSQEGQLCMRDPHHPRNGGSDPSCPTCGGDSGSPLFETTSARAKEEGSAGRGYCTKAPTSSITYDMGWIHYGLGGMELMRNLVGKLTGTGPFAEGRRHATPNGGDRGRKSDEGRHWKNDD